MNRSQFRTTLRGGLVTLLATVAAAVLTTSGVASATAQQKTRPTVVLVHGAFADSSGFTETIKELQVLGYPVLAVANPLRGLHPDAAYLRSVLSTIPGPVVLVGHSYGGAVMSEAAVGIPRVKALVFLAAYAPAEGETLGAAGALGGGTSLLPQHVVARPYPGAPDGDADGYIDPAYFRAVFAADVPAAKAAVMAAAQRPLALSALGTPAAVPAWKTVPSYYLVAKQDQAIPVQAQRAMAARAGSRTVEINSSHAVMVSHPEAVTALIVAASGR
ncbi:alpha/beta fold hydrolase [Nakamurella sp. YIM 132087]|uniref:Alpha/beta fold hydrolase n=1 Tax=Nakamurella alba TaxID=2665158 RepID=A0A7K1FM98_9ACTN|nr:alpha/beta hydrolase [Nakamurella alba]MTD15287.1 alpha/beta fold hydrolase [Nakamurella alba]